MSAFDEIFDFVVVGSGAGSMCAALVMARAGKSVAILEKLPKVGGTTARSGGVMWIPDNPFMAAAGVEDSYLQAVRYLDSLVGDDPTAPGASRERRLTYLREGPRMIEFLLSQGIKLKRVGYWPDYADDLPGGSKSSRAVVAELFDMDELGPWKDRLIESAFPIPADQDELMQLPHFRRSWRGFRTALKVALRIAAGKVTGKTIASCGRALQGRMLQAVLAAGVEVRVDCPVSELVTEDGAVTGVVARMEGRARRIGARLGVLVNAGGFAHNQAMRDRYLPGTRTEWSQTNDGDTGEMIEEMERCGAALAQMDEMVGNQVTLPPGLRPGQPRPIIQRSAASPHAIIVDQSGVRYQSEGGSYMAFCKGMRARDKLVPASPSWIIVDRNHTDRYMLAMAGKATLKRWAREGFLRKAQTIEDLARLLEMEPATLRATVERFNGFVANNRDEDFHRGERAYDQWLGDPYHSPSVSLGAIEKPPFCALPVYPGDVGTYGGAVTDAQARVLRPDGSVIPGLYATATSTASVMGRAYPGAGSSIGPGFVWGYVAALHAAGLDNDRAAASAPAGPAA
jgi:3-oxosteroid 1-dehydrogenase